MATVEWQAGDTIKFLNALACFVVVDDFFFCFICVSIGNLIMAIFTHSDLCFISGIELCILYFLQNIFLTFIGIQINTLF